MFLFARSRAACSSHNLWFTKHFVFFSSRSLFFSLSPLPPTSCIVLLLAFLHIRFSVTIFATNITFAYYKLNCFTATMRVVVVNAAITWIYTKNAYRTLQEMQGIHAFYVHTMCCPQKGADDIPTKNNYSAYSIILIWFSLVSVIHECYMFIILKQIFHIAPRMLENSRFPCYWKKS